MLNRVLNFILPQKCLVCVANTHQRISICDQCYRELPWNTHYCQICALPLQHEKMHYCSQCIKRKPLFNKVLAAFRYQEPIAHCIMQIKFEHQLRYIPLLSQAMIAYLQQERAQTSLPSAIIPVPLHRKRLQQRGFNQALELAKPIAQHFKIPLIHQYCKRIQATKAQAQLHGKARADNVARAFLNRPSY